MGRLCRAHEGRLVVHDGRIDEGAAARLPLDARRDLANAGLGAGEGLLRRDARVRDGLRRRQDDRL